MLNGLRNTAMRHIDEIANLQDAEIARKQARKEKFTRVIQKLNPKTLLAGPQ